MPQYLFLLYDREDLWADATPDDWAREMQRHDDFTASVEAAEGARVLGGEALAPQATATTLRPGGPGGAPVVTDGPFLEVKEALGGYYLLECRDLDQALELARGCPVIDGGVEVRPVLDMTGQ